MFNVLSINNVSVNFISVSSEVNKQREAIVKKVWNKISQKLSQSHAFSGGKRGDVKRLQKWPNTSKCSEKNIKNKLFS